MMRTLYSPIEAFDSFKLSVSAIHTLYVEQAGNPQGLPILFLHGGPGGGIQDDHRRYFHPDKWRIILFDQRGCGKSEPFGSLEQNTTWDLVEDIEKIRRRLNIEKWHLFGGSWGSTLALAYGQTHPSRVLGLILRGIFLLRQKEIDWFYQYGASEIYPEAWEDFIAPIPKEERHQLLLAYHQRLTSNDPKIVQEAAKAWSLWEGRTISLLPRLDIAAQFGGEPFSYAFARIENHYFYHKGFFPEDGWLLHHVHRLHGIKATIIHGRYDIVCPASNAWQLHQAWPSAQLQMVSDAGHAGSEPGITSALVQATDDFAGCHT